MKFITSNLVFGSRSDRTVNNSNSRTDDSDIEGVLDLDVDEEGDDDGSDVDSDENEDLAYAPVPGMRKKCNSLIL